MVDFPPYSLSQVLLREIRGLGLPDCDVILGTVLGHLDVSRAPTIIGLIPGSWVAGEELTGGPRDCQVEQITWIVEIWTSMAKDPEDAYARSGDIANQLRAGLGGDREAGPIELVDCGPLKLATIWEYEDTVNSGMLARQTWTCARLEP